MELDQLRYFARVAELRHFTRAAHDCGISQPSLSQQISKLERELGQKLFDRIGKTVRLTEAGVRLKDHVDHILRLVEDVRGQLTDGADAGRLVVGAIPTIAPYLLPRPLEELGRRFPRARVEVVEETTASLLQLLGQGKVDIAVLALPVRSDDIATETLFSEALLVALRSTHPLAAKKTVRPVDIDREPFVLLHDAHCLTDETLNYCRRAAVSPLATGSVHQLATIQQLVSVGRGISLIPEMAAKIDRDPSRCYRPVAGKGPSRTVAMAWNRHRYESVLCKEFAGLLRKLPEGGRERKRKP